MSQFNFRRAIQFGLIAGVVAVSVSAIGMVETFDERDIITGVLTLGQLLLYIIPVLAGYLSVPVSEEGEMQTGPALASGAITGFVTAIPLVGLILLALAWPLIRESLVNVSPALIDILTFGQDSVVGIVILVAVMTLLGLVSAAFHLLPEKIEKPLLAGLVWMLGIGLFSEILLNIFRPLPRTVVRFFFGSKGIQPWTAIVIFVIAAGIAAYWNARGKERFQFRRASLTRAQETRLQKAGRVSFVLLILALPWILGIYLTEVMDIVGIFILMGLGLNIVVGFAGLLDLGYVAFFAIGAYVMGLLVSTGDLGMGLSFWVALPIAVLTAILFGIMLGVPVLRMRGDYLAIVTLGFGEIIQVLAASDLLKSAIGGAQGIIKIGKPEVLSFVFVQPQHFYYLILAGVLLAIFVSRRMRDSRLGRQWMALREDEDVAEAMGINLVKTKLLAFAIGAAFGGLAGAIFASRLGSIFPYSFDLLISINVLSLIIVGGIGSIPGVIVGALFLVGMPELLREFAEYRLLIYGALLIAMMLLRPEGIWPSPIRKLELHADADIAAREGIHHEEVADLV